MSVEEVEIIRDMFALMDTDNDGKITFEELKAGMRKVGSQLADPEIRLLMDVVSHPISILIPLKSVSFTASVLTQELLSLNLTGRC